MGIQSDYAEAMYQSLIQINPELKKHKKQVMKILYREIEEKMLDPHITMDNNVTGQRAEITLSKTCQWIQKRKPVISGNATFFCQPEELASPTSTMLRALKQERKAVKKKMFQYKPGSDEYVMLDEDQGNKKVIMNADYGGSGTKTAAFYTKYSPAATTLMAQSIITTMAAFFEGFIGDNQKFYHINECYDWLVCVQKKTEPIPDWVIRPTPSQVADRIHRHFIEPTFQHWNALDQYIQNLTSDQLTYLYYANNLNEFIRMHSLPRQLLHDILSKLPNYTAAVKEVPEGFRENYPDVEKYNRFISKEMFLNPYEVPPIIQNEMAEFIRLITQFIYVEYLTPDSIVKLNNHERNTVLLVDTDSNMINADLFVHFVTHELFPGNHFGRDPMYNDMILVNVLAATIDKSVANILDYYGRCHNMDEAARKELSMKNEFMFRIFFLMETKKRYAASIILREGNIIYPFKPEIKGMDFIKAGISDEVEEKFKGMLCRHILFAEQLDLHGLMEELKAFEREIYQKTKSGDSQYLKQSQYKPLSSYKSSIKEDGTRVDTGWSQQAFRGSYIWNKLVGPDQQIKILDQIKIVKLIVNKVEDLDIIKNDYPDIYQKILMEVFINGEPEVKKNGLRTICIPANIPIPKWMRPLIDYDVVVSDMISSFRSILDSLQMTEFTFKTPTGKATTTSCLISL